MCCRKCCKSGRKHCRCSVWGERFWNDFYSPRHPGVFLILLVIIASIAFTCCYILLAIYFEAFCTIHADAYLVIFVSNLACILSAVLIMHFLTMSPDSLTFSRCALLYFGIFASLVLGVTAIIQFNIQPTNKQMHHYIKYFFDSYKRVPRIMDELHKEKKCCGVYSIKDFLVGDNIVNNTMVRQLPDTCCDPKVKIGRDCGKFLTADDIPTNKTLTDVLTKGFFLKGCFGNTTFADLKSESPTAYANTHWVIDWAYFNPLITLALFGIYSYYICYKLTKEKEPPPWAQDDFKNDIKRTFRQKWRDFCSFCSKKKPDSEYNLRLPEDEERAEASKRQSEFQRMHSIIGNSLSSLDPDSVSGGTSTADGSVLANSNDSFQLSAQSVDAPNGKGGAKVMSDSLLTVHSSGSEQVTSTTDPYKKGPYGV